MLKLVECVINLRRATLAYSDFGVMLCCLTNLFEHSRYGIKNVYFAFFLPNHYDLAQQCSLPNRTFFFSRCHVSLVFYIYRGQSISFQQSLSVFCINIHKLDGENTISPMKFSFFLMDLKQTQLSLFSYHGLHDRLGYQNFSTNALVPVVSRSCIP